MPKSTVLLLSAAIVSSVLLAACSKQAPETETAPAMEESTSAPAPTSETAAVTPTEAAETITAGKELTVTTSYKSPAADEKVGFTLVVDEDGVITDAKTEVLTTQPISIERQTKFAEGLPAAVKGKKLSELTKIDRVGGSSLTTGAFNAALKDLKAQL